MTGPAAIEKASRDEAASWLCVSVYVAREANAGAMRRECEHRLRDAPRMAPDAASTPVGSLDPLNMAIQPTYSLHGSPNVSATGL